MPAPTKAAATRITDARLADLADAVLELADKLDPRHPELRDVVPLTGTEVVVIRELHRHPHSTPSQLAAATGLQRSNVSTALRALEAAGLVLREQDGANARQVVLVPTAKAARNVESIRAFWAERLRHAPREDLLRLLAAAEALARVATHVGAD